MILQEDVTSAPTEGTVTAAAVVAAPNFPSTKDIAEELLTQMLAKGIAIPQPQQHFQHAVPTNTTTHTSSHIPSSQPAQGTTYTVSSRSTIPSTSQP